MKDGWKDIWSFVVALAAVFVLTRGLVACERFSTSRITAENVKAAYTCLSQVRGLALNVQQQIPACVTLADAVKTEGPTNDKAP
jgi:hypothetical protein